MSEIQLPLQPPSRSESLSPRPPFISQEFQRKIESQDKSRRATIAFTDLDGTWLNSTDKTAHPAAQRVKRALDKNNVPLIAVTGRPIDLIEGDKRLFPDFPFDAMFTAVGTELWVPNKTPQGQWTFAPDADWESYIRTERGFKRELIYPECVKIRDRLLGENPNSHLVFQERDEPSNVAAWEAFDASKNEKAKPAEKPPEKFKVSYRFSGTLTDSASMKERFLKELKNAGYEKTYVVVSQGKKVDEDILEFNMDVVPVTKADAIKYLAGKTQTEMHLSEAPLTIYAGDSGNDIEPMSVADVGVIAGGPKNSDFDGWKRELGPIRESASGGFFTVPDTDMHASRLFLQEGRGSTAEGPESLDKARRKLELLIALQSPKQSASGYSI